MPIRSQTLALLATHSPPALLVQINLVAHNLDHHALAGALSDIVDPARDIVEGGSVGDIEDY
jgi:hypothetical protein